MNGEVALRVALVSYGNAFLAGRSDVSVEGNSTLQFLGATTFTFGARVAHSPTEWFEMLNRDGVDRLELPLGPGGIAAFGSTSAVWTGGLELRAETNQVDGRVWDLRMQRVDADVSPHPGYSVPLVSGMLETALEQAEGFAAERDWHWADVFRNSRALLASDDPQIPYHADLMPAPTPLAVRRLSAAAVSGYVFGGMGSWNDVSFSDEPLDAEERYNAVSAALFQAVNTALVTAANHIDVRLSRWRRNSRPWSSTWRR